MKASRRVMVYFLLMVALFTGGAVLGSLVPKTILYVYTSAGAVALALFGLWFYNGHENNKKASVDDDIYDDESED